MEQMTKSGFDAWQSGFKFVNRLVQPQELRDLNTRMFEDNIAMTRRCIAMANDYTDLLKKD